MTHGRVDPEWDAFVEEVAGGSYQQSSRWLSVKAVVGWTGLRVIARDGDGILGGCQLLVRRLGPGLAVAFAPRAPLAAGDDPAIVVAVLDAVERAAAGRRVRYLKLQPPGHRDDLGAALEVRGFAASDLEAAPTTTVHVALDRPLDALEAGMRRNARRNVGRCRQQGIRVRAGDAADLPVLFALLDATARRQAFAAYPHAYYARMWAAFAAGGRARLLLAEHDGEAVAGQMAVAHGDVVTNVAAGRADARPDVRPNELLHLAAMAWGQELGARVYDLNGVDLPGAGATVDGGGTAGGQGVTHFKLGIGGEVVSFPGAYDRLLVPFGKVLARRVAPELRRLWPVAQRVLGRGGGA